MSEVVDFGKAKAAVESDGWSDATMIICECGCTTFNLVARGGREPNEPLAVVCANCDHDIDGIPPVCPVDTVPASEDVVDKRFRQIYGAEDEMDMMTLARNRAAKMLQEGEAAMFAYCSCVTGRTTLIVPPFEDRAQIDWANERFTAMIELAQKDLEFREVEMAKEDEKSGD